MSRIFPTVIGGALAIFSLAGASAAPTLAAIDNVFVRKMVSLNVDMICQEISFRDYNESMAALDRQRRRELFGLYGGPPPRDIAMGGALRARIDTLTKAKVRAMTPHHDTREIPSCARRP